MFLFLSGLGVNRRRENPRMEKNAYAAGCYEKNRNRRANCRSYFRRIDQYGLVIRANSKDEERITRADAPPLARLPLAHADASMHIL